MMDAAYPADDERAPDNNEHGYVELRKPSEDGQNSTSTGPVRSPVATSSRPAGSPASQSPLDQLERDMETSQQFLNEAVRSRRFPDAARYQMMIWKSRLALAAKYPFSLDEKLDLTNEHAKILLECDEPHKSPPPFGLDELERNANSLDSRKWGELCARMGLLFMRWTELQDLQKSKTYLQLALKSLAKLRSGIDLLPISQDLADVYNLQGDLGGADEHFNVDGKVDIRRIDRVQSWCENHRFKAGRFDARDVERGVSPLQLAVKQQYVDPLKIMLSFTQRTVPRDTMVSIASDLLLLAADTRNIQIAELLIEAGADVGTIDQQGRSGLHRCQFCPEKGNEGGLRIAGLFLEKKKSLINHTDKEGKTALAMACEAGHVSMAELLLESGSDPSVLDMHGKTCLYTACEKGDLEIVRVLLTAVENRPTAQGLDINARGPGGCTPIILAVRAASANRKKVNVVKELMRHHADPDIRDHRGNDAFRYVTGLAAREIEQALMDKGSQPLLSSIPFSPMARTRSQSMSSSRAEAPSTMLFPTDHASTSAGPKRNKVMGFWNIGQSGSKVSLAPSVSTYDSSSGFRSIFSRRSSNSRTTALSSYSQDTPAVQSLLEVDEEAASCKQSDYDAASIGSHEPLSPHPAQPRPPNNLGQRADESEDEPDDEPDDSSSTVSNEPHSHEDYYCSSTSTDDFPTPSGSDVVSERLSNDYSESEPQAPNLHHELPIRPSPFQGSQGQVQSGIRQHASHNSPNDNSPPFRTPDGSRGSGNAPRRGGREPGRSGGRDNARRRAAVLRAAQDDGASTDKYFACPFAKHNFFRHRDCTSYCGKRVRDVKQHIRRVHYHPYYCPRCYQVFGSSGERDEHTRVMSCNYQQERKLDSITDEQDERLARQCPSHMNNDHPAQWYYMFGIIFPGQRQPESPYVDFDPYLICDSLKKFTREHAAKHTASQAGQLPCWDTNHLSAIVNIVTGLVDHFCNSLQGHNPTSTSTFDPHTPDSLVNTDPVSDVPIPAEMADIELHNVLDHFQVPTEHQENLIPMLYKHSEERGISPDFLHPDHQWELPSPAPDSQVSMTGSRNYRTPVDHSGHTELSGCSDCARIPLFGGSNAFSPQQFEHSMVNYGPSVGDNVDVGSMSTSTMRGPRTSSSSASPGAHHSLAMASENISAVAPIPQAHSFFDGQESNWYGMQTPYGPHYFGPQGSPQPAMMYSTPQPPGRRESSNTLGRTKLPPQSVEDNADAWTRLTPSDYSN